MSELTIYPDLEQGSEEWLEARRGILTASQVGTLITAKTVKPAVNDYSRGLTMQLVTERITGETEPVYVNADMERGHLAEPDARNIYTEHYAEATEVGFMTREINGHLLGYSPDGVVGDDGLIEIKAPRAKKHIATIINGQIPEEHVAQIQAGLLVSGRAWCDFISYRAGLPFFVKRVLPDPVWFDAITEALETFETVAAEKTAHYETVSAHLIPTPYIDYLAVMEIQL